MGLPNVRNFETDSAAMLIASCGCNARAALVIQRLVAERDRLRSLVDGKNFEPEPEDIENTIHRVNTVTGSAWAEVAWDEDDGSPTLMAIRPYTGWVSADDLDPSQVEEWERVIAAEEADASAEARESYSEA